MKLITLSTFMSAQEASYVRKTSVYLLCFSFSFTPPLHSRDTSRMALVVTKYVEASLQDTSWVYYTLTQFWHRLPGDSVISHRLRAQPHENLPQPPQHLCWAYCLFFNRRWRVWEVIRVRWSYEDGGPKNEIRAYMKV